MIAAFFAFLHHIAAFALVSAISAEFLLIREELTLRGARKILFADMVVGIAAATVLVAGLLRVFFLKKARTIMRTMRSSSPKCRFSSRSRSCRSIRRGNSFHGGKFERGQASRAIRR